MRKALISLAGIICLVSLAASGTEFWEKKKFHQWSEGEVKKLLTDSPWAHEYVVSEVHIDAPPASFGADSNAEANTREREQQPQMIYRVQFRSALPIRQALVRRAQLQQGYDQLPAEQKKGFDQQAEKFLAEEFPEQVVIYVSFDTNVNLDLREAARYWQTQTTEKLKNSAYLIGAKGAKAQLQDFTLADQGGQAFQFTFPRTVEGQALAASQDKELQLEFIHPNIRGRGEKRVLVKFNIKNMVLDSQLEY